MTVRLVRRLRLQVRADAGSAGPDEPIPVVIATTTPVDRYGVLEVLDCSAEGADLARAPLSLIVCHDANQLAIGVVENLVAEGTQVSGDARFGASPEAQQVRADVLGGIHQYVSVGYELLDEGTPIEGGRKFRWRPFEVSIVPVPADPAAGFFRSLPGVHSMTAVNSNRDADAITALCARHHVAHLAQDFIARGLNVEQAGAAILDGLVRRDRESGGHLNVTRSQQGGAQDDAERIINSLAHRMGAKVSGDVIRSTDLAGLARRALELAGRRVYDEDSRDRILQRALTTSDFPQMLGSAVGRVLQTGYAEAPAALKAIARQANLPDFRDKSAIRLGPTSALEKVNEHGEFKHGSIEEAKNTWRLSTYGKIISITRQALVNDDLGGFNTIVMKFGQAAARLEADQLTAMLTAPPQVDGAALFSVGRSSFITKVLGLQGLGDAVKALRAQKDLDGGIVNHEPSFLVVPAALEMTARQLVTSITPAQTSEVQPYSLSVVVEPRLDASSTTAWYLVSKSQTALEYGYLDGAEGVQTFTDEGFEIDGVSIKARLDFGTGWVAPIGWVKSDGST